MGDVQTGMRYADEMKSLAEQSGDLQALFLHEGIVSGYLLRTGRYAEARERLERYLERCGPDDKGRLVALPMLAHARLKMGDLEEADHLIAECTSIADAKGDLPSLAYASMLSGMLLVERGQSTSAVQVFEEALAVYRRVGEPPGVAYALRESASALAAGGDVEQARAQLRESLSIWSRLGALPEVTEVERQLASLPSES
jgi:tetratricopeptide (TPR) repeat protein